MSALATGTVMLSDREASGFGIKPRVCARVFAPRRPFAAAQGDNDRRENGSSLV